MTTLPQWDGSQPVDDQSFGASLEQTLVENPPWPESDCAMAIVVQQAEKWPSGVRSSICDMMSVAVPRLFKTELCNTICGLCGSQVLTA